MQAVSAEKNRITVKGRTFPIPDPSAADLRRIQLKMRSLAMRECQNPVAAINAVAADLSPAVLETALRLAIVQASGGGVEPTAEAVARQFESPEGVRFQLWFLARKAEPSLAQSEVDALVSDDDVYDVADALYVATRPADSGPKPSPAGAS